MSEPILLVGRMFVVVLNDDVGWGMIYSSFSVGALASSLASFVAGA